MSSHRKGLKLKKSFASGETEVSKYKAIRSIEFHPGRPGEEYFEVVDEDGKRTPLSPDEKRRLDKLIKKG